MNYITVNNYKSLKPEVGMGATEMLHSDRHAYTVTWVHPNGKRAIIQADKVTRTDTNGMSDMQHYTFEPNPQGKIYPIKMYKDGHWHVYINDGYFKGKSSVVMIGHREEYYDYSF
jgi:hypothetical protein